MIAGNTSTGMYISYIIIQACYFQVIKVLYFSLFLSSRTFPRITESLQSYIVSDSVGSLQQVTSRYSILIGYIWDVWLLGRPQVHMYFALIKKKMQ